MPELVTSPHTTLPVDTPPLVAVKMQSRLSQSSGPAEAAPVIVSVAPVSAPVAAKLAAVAAPEAVSVPVDTSPTVVKFPALTVLLMVNVLPVIPVAELSRPTLAAPLMLSELPDTAPVDEQRGPGDGAGGCERSAGNGARGVHARGEHVGAVHVVAQQLVAAHVALRGEPVQRGRAREGQRVRHSKALALICMLYRSSVPADCCTSPGIEPPKAPKCSLAIPPSGTEKSRRAVLQTPCEGVPRKVPVTPT